MNSEEHKQIIFVQGPTASGKSNWAMTEAKKTQSIIINCDSIQFYRGMDIGSAKPSFKEQNEIPHFLIDVANPDQPVNAAHFRNLALEVIDQWYTKAQIFVVGGSGFYFQALEYGVFDSPPTDSDLLGQLKKSKSDLYQELLRVDPEAAKTISSADHYRIERALTVFLQTGQTLSSLKNKFLKNKTPFPYPIKKIGLQPQNLLEHIRLRTDRMLKDGLIDEVTLLRQKGFGKSRALQSVGYKECQMYLDEQITKQELLELIVLHTRQLAKKQMTWFKRDKQIVWISA